MPSNRSLVVTQLMDQNKNNSRPYLDNSDTRGPTDVHETLSKFQAKDPSSEKPFDSPALHSYLFRVHGEHDAELPKCVHVRCSSHMVKKPLFAVMVCDST